MWAALLPLVLWLATIAACVYEDGMNLFQWMGCFSRALEHPFSVRWTAHTLKFMLGSVFLYGCGIALYYSGRENRRPGEEYGSAKWGNPKELNRKYMDHQHNLEMDTTLFAYLRENPPQGHSLEYADCRLSLLSAQKGKCSVSGELFLNPDNIVCHMKVPKEQGGHERYSNLVLLHRRYLPLLTDQDTAALKSMCKQLTVTKKQLTKINSLRTAAKLVAI